MLELRNHHLTIVAKLVGTNLDSSAVCEGHAVHVLGAQVLLLASDDLIAVTDEVVITLELDQLVANLLHIVDVQVVIDNAVLHVGNDHLTVVAKLVGTDLDGSAICKGHTIHVLGAQVLPLASDDLIAVADEVEVALKLHQLVANLLHVVDVQVVIDHTILDLGNNHLTLVVELVVANANGSAVRKGHAGHETLAEIYLAALSDLVAVADKVEIAIILDQLVSRQSLTVLIEIVIIRAVQQSSDTVGTAVVVEDLRSRTCEGVTVEYNTGLHIAGAAEEVGVAVDLIGTAGCSLGRGVLIVTGAVPVAGSLLSGYPYALGHAAVLKDERDALVGDLLTVKTCIGGHIKVIPIIVNTDPTAGQASGNGVVRQSVNNHQAGTGVCMTAVTDKLSVFSISYVGVTGSGNGGAPLNHGVADLAVGSAGVAGLSAGRSLILDLDGGMNVGRAVLQEVDLIHVRHAGVHLGIHVELLVGEGGGGAVHVGDETHVNVHLQILCPECIGGPVGLGGVAGNQDVGIEVQHTDGQLSQNGGAGQVVVACAGDGDGGGVGLLENGVLGGEAVSQVHMIQLPVVDVVEVDHGGNGINGLDVGGLQVHPVDRAEVDAIQGRIGGNHVDGRGADTRLHLDDADDNRLVARLVADLELDAVVTVGHHVTVGGHDAVSVGASHLNAVDVDLSGGGIQTGCVVQGNLVLVGVQTDGLVSHGGREVQDVAGGGHYVTLDQSGGLVQIDLVKDGVLSVVHGVGVVNGEVIQVVGVVTVDGAVGCPQHIVDGLVEYDSQEELTLLTGHTVAGILVVLGSGLQSDLGEGGDVHGQVMPAGFVDVVVDVLGFHHTDDVLGVEYAVAVGVGHVVTLYPALDVVLGYVEPEADRTGVLQNDGITVHAQTDPGVLLGVGVCGGQTVGLQAHGILAVVNLTVGAVGQGQIQIVIPVSRVLTVVDDVPDVNVRLAALEVPQNLGALTQVQLNRGRGVGAHIQGHGHGTGQVSGGEGLIHGGKAQPVEGTESLIGGGEGHVAVTQTDLEVDTVNVGSRLHGDLDGLAEGHGDHGLLKVQRVGGSDGDGLFTHDLAVVDHLSRHGTLGAVGGKDTVLDGAHALLLDSPLNVVGNIHLGTDSVRTERVEGNGCAGGVIVVIRGDGCLREHTVSGSGGDHEERIRRRSFTTVGQGTVDLQILTGTLRAEGGRATAVAVGGNDTAHLDHVIGHLIVGEAGGVGCLLTVGHSDHESTVGLDAHEGSGGDARTVRRAVFRILVHGVTVCVGLDQEAEQHGNGLLLPAGQGIGSLTDPDLGHIVGASLACEGMVVVVDDDDGLNAAAVRAFNVLAVRIHLAVQNGVAERLTDQLGVLIIVCGGVPAQGGVGSDDHVAVAQLLCFQSLGGGGLDTVVAFLRPHTLGAGDDLDKGVIDIHYSGVKHLSSRTFVVVQDDFGLLNTGGEIPALLGNDVVVRTSTVAVVVNACKCVHRDHADQHDDRESHCQNFGHLTDFHSFFLLFINFCFWIASIYKQPLG